MEEMKSSNGLGSWVCKVVDFRRQIKLSDELRRKILEKSGNFKKKSSRNKRFLRSAQRGLKELPGSGQSKILRPESEPAGCICWRNVKSKLHEACGNASFPRKDKREEASWGHGGKPLSRVPASSTTKVKSRGLHLEGNVRKRHHLFLGQGKNTVT